MSSQRLRVVFAFVLTLASLLGVMLLSMTSHDVPELLKVIATGSLFYLFGVTTNGAPKSLG